jgi:predicted nucleic acid-binding protein
VKLYADEDRHEQVRGLRAPLVISTLARVEVSAAIWRKQRSGELNLDDALTLLRAFTVDYTGGSDRAPRFLAVSVTDGIVERAAELTGTYGLRAYDAVQLASALATREADSRCTTFAVFDRDLASAAASEGFQTLPAKPPEPDVPSALESAPPPETDRPRR